MSYSTTYSVMDGAHDLIRIGPHRNAGPPTCPCNENRLDRIYNPSTLYELTSETTQILVDPTSIVAEQTGNEPVGKLELATFDRKDVYSAFRV